MLRPVTKNASTVRLTKDERSPMNARPCLRLRNTESVVFAGTKRLEMSDRVSIGARKDTALSPKHHDSPNFDNASPARAGPTVIAILNWIEFRAIALGMSSRSTRVGISAW